MPTARCSTCTPQSDAIELRLVPTPTGSPKSGDRTAPGIGVLLADHSQGADDFVRAVRVAAGDGLVGEFIEFGDSTAQDPRER
jgi:hypothetical protein